VTQDAGVDALASDATTSADAPASLDEAGIPIDLAAFRNDIAQASARAQAAGGPAWCAMAPPSVRVSSAAEVTAAVRSFVSQVLGTAASNLQMAPQACGGPGHAPCADVFNLNAGGFGGPINTEIYPLAQRIDQNATSVQVTVVTLPPSGGASVVVTAGIKDGWLMGLAVFGGLRCG
jgi:hypothetical protein